MSRKFVGVTAVAGLVLAGGLGAVSRDASAGGYGFGGYGSYGGCGYGACGYSGCGYSGCGYSGCGYSGCGYAGCGYSGCGYSGCGSAWGYGGQGYGGQGYGGQGYGGHGFGGHGFGGHGYGGHGYGGHGFGGHGFGGHGYGSSGTYDPWSRRYEHFDPNPTYGLPAYYRLMNPAALHLGRPAYRRSIQVTGSSPVVGTVGTTGAVSHSTASEEFIEVGGRRIPAVRLVPH